MLIGYARVSSDDQNLDLQLDALSKYGCEKIYQDRLSGSKVARPGLIKALQMSRPGDSLVVWRLDRLGRSIKDLISLAELLKERSIGLCSLQESLNTSSSSGQLVFHLFAALAEFERNLIRERVQAGLSAARARGKTGGRPNILDQKKREVLLKMHNDKQYSIKEICDIMGISKTTFYNYVGKSHPLSLSKLD